MILAASDGTISGMFGDVFSATAPIPIVVIIFLAVLAFLAVKGK